MPRNAIIAVFVAAAIAAASAGNAAAGNWMDPARGGAAGVVPSLPILPFREPVASPSGPVLFDSEQYALQHGFDVNEIAHFAFVPLHKDGIFDYTPEALIYVPPVASAHDGPRGEVSLAPMAVWLRPNYALYGNQPQHYGDQYLVGPLRPSESLLRGVSPRITAIGRR
jgi:hypothetical protein